MLTLRRRYILFAVAVVAILWGYQLLDARKTGPRKVRYDELLVDVRAGRVAQVELRASEIRAQLASGEALVAARLPNVDEAILVGELDKHRVALLGQVERTSGWITVAINLLPMLLLGGYFYWSSRRLRTARDSPLTFGKSRGKIVDRNRTDRVTFADVGGVDEARAELVEVVHFLTDSDRYDALGAHLPKGVLLVGPPGTGKTLMARAVAGEANVPFFSLSGSEFVEMFVGVGASRMRDLFEQAKARAPCIVFIDELDAIGKSRGGPGGMGGHDEREQTLNQLLVEMDGFDPGAGVVIMAATNRPEVLDPALVRPGRFDRQILVDRPSLGGRLAILRLHARGVPLAKDVELELVARRTPGMVGAGLANVINEAALAAGRRRATTVAARDFEEAVDRIQLGLKQAGRVMTESEKRRVAYHEAGHALVALTVEHADPVHRVTIIPRSIGALGVTLQLPTEERFLMTRDELADRIAVMFGGRAAEEVVFRDVSTGAQNDLERATETARQMVCRFGMTEALGAVVYGRPAGPRYLEALVDLGEERNFSDETARAIDAEVRAILEAGRARARQILDERRASLELIATRLLDVETLEQDELLWLAATPQPIATLQ